MIDAQLNEVTIKQLTWKPTTMQRVAVAITKYFIENPFGFHFTDCVDVSFILKNDANCIGMAWRNLVRNGILERGGHFRRSQKAGNRGSAVFDYRILSVTRAKTFLERNNVVIADPQTLLL